MPSFKEILTILIVVALAEAFGVLGAIRNVFSGFAGGMQPK